MASDGLLKPGRPASRARTSGAAPGSLTFEALRDWPHLLTCDALAPLLGLTTAGLRVLCYERRIPAYKPGKAWLLHGPTIHAWFLARQAVPATRPGRR